MFSSIYNPFATPIATFDTRALNPFAFSSFASHLPLTDSSGIKTGPTFLLPISTTAYNSKTSSAFININPSNPLLSTTGFYKDLNKDKSIQKSLSKYYYYKILDKWIYNNLKPLLAFVNISSGKAHLIKSMEDFDVLSLEKDSSEDINKKIEYMEEMLITKQMVKHVLKKICRENNIKWYDLNKHTPKIKKVFYNYFLDKLKTSINKYGNK